MLFINNKMRHMVFWFRRRRFSLFYRKIESTERKRYIPKISIERSIADFGALTTDKFVVNIKFLNNEYRIYFGMLIW